SNTVAQSLRPFPQFGQVTTAGVTNSALVFAGAPLGRTWYDSLQSKVTKRFSHGLDFTYTFTWQKDMTMGTETEAAGTLSPTVAVNDVFNRQLNKYISGYSQPFLNVLAANYTLPNWGSNKWLSYAVKDWNIGTVLQYSSGLP